MHMLTEKEIAEIANKYVQEIEKRSGIQLLIGEGETIKKPYKHAIAGNAPFLVEKETGNITVFGTAHMEDYYVKEYEAGRWPK